MSFLETVNNMSDDEVKALNDQLSRELGKAMLSALAANLAFYALYYFGRKKLDRFMDNW